MSGNINKDLSVEHCLLTGVVYDLFQPLHLHDVDFQSTTSDKRYVLYVHHRLYSLNERLKSLATMYSMLSYESFPLNTEEGNISRQEWVHITLDTMLSRITSVRDCVYLLIDSIFELQLPPRKVNRKSLIKNESIKEHEQLISLINSITNSGSILRNERDALFHRGERRVLGDNPEIYYIASAMESMGQSDFGTGPDGEKIDLDKEHKIITNVINNEFTESIEELVGFIDYICLLLYPVFKNRFIENMEENGGIHPSAISLIDRAEHYAEYFKSKSDENK